MLKEKKYFMGKRFFKYSILATFIGSVLVFIFYFLYRIILIPRIPALQGAPLTAIFCAFELLMVLVIRKITQSLSVKNYYLLDDTGLTEVHGEKKRVYRWEDFESVEEARFEFSAICPICFRVNGQKLIVNQYLDDIWELHRQVFSRIEDHVVIPAELKKRVQAMAE